MPHKAHGLRSPPMHRAVALKMIFWKLTASVLYMSIARLAQFVILRFCADVDKEVEIPV